MSAEATAGQDGVHICRIMAFMKRGVSWPDDEDADVEAKLPPEFAVCHQIWLENQKKRRFSKRDFQRIRDLLEPRLIGLFLPDNLSNAPGAIQSNAENPCTKLAIAGCDFSGGLLPVLSIKAFFELPLRQPIADRDELEAWQDENDNLDWGVYFRFDFVVDDGIYIDVGFNQHSGMEIYGPLAEDDPGLTYAERVTGVVQGAFRKMNTKPDA